LYLIVTFYFVILSASFPFSVFCVHISTSAGGVK